MAEISPYIHFNGNAEEAFNFYKSVFGGTFTTLVRFKEMLSEEYPMPETEHDKLAHIALPIGSNSVLLGSDTPSFMGTHNLQETRSKISIAAASKEEADHLFHGLSIGGTIEMPMADSPWGAYFGMFRDQYGIEWMVSYDAKQE